MTSLTFVTAFMNIYETPFQNKDIEWRFQHFRKIANLGIQIVVFCSPDCKEVMENMRTEFPNIQVLEYMDLKDTWTYKTCTSIEGVEMPNNRNVDKDTKEYIILMNAKTEFLKRAVEANVWDSTHFAWIDFNLFHVFKNENDEKYAGELIYRLSKRTLRQTFLTMPGCWHKHHVVDEYLINDICWRWCGGFFLGDKQSVLAFHAMHELHLSEFLELKKKLVWEVNFWAWLEKTYNMSIIWYHGDHNISILEIGGEVCSFNLPIQNSYQYKFPMIGDFQSTSMSYIKYKDEHIFNIRYINYWLYPTGSYLINHPEKHIYTKNYYSYWNPELGFLHSCLNEMDEDSISLENHGGSIYGLEDIRLYEYNDTIYFIATNINYSGIGRNRMIKGIYNIEKRTYDNCTLIIPPNRDSWCEKNWTPLIKGDKEYFIYKWSPFEIGTIVEKQEESGNTYHQLDICSQFLHRTPFFHKVRGSTPFIETEDGYLGVVHFSEEKTPRQYFHLLVLLDKETFHPLRYSNHFYFHNTTIEFCIGFSIIDNKYHFWISNFDRNPELVISEIESIPISFDFFVYE